jgi:hypothetical protein
MKIMPSSTPKSTTVFDLLYGLVTGASDACIVCSSTCSDDEVALARSEGRVVVLDDGMGILLRPGTAAPAIPGPDPTPRLCGATVEYDKDIVLRCNRATGHPPPHSDLTVPTVWCDLMEGECSCAANHAYRRAP